MRQFFINYFLPWTGITILLLLSIRSILNDILIGSLPGKYGKANTEAMRIREKHSFFEQMTQRYIGQYVIEEYRTDYRFYVSSKATLGTYYLLGILTLFVSTSMGEIQMALLLWKIFMWIDAVMGVFLITRFDLNRRSKYTRNK